MYKGSLCQNLLDFYYHTVLKDPSLCNVFKGESVLKKVAN